MKRRIPHIILPMIVLLLMGACIGLNEAHAYDPTFTTGYNQAWIEQDYGRDMTGAFTLQKVERLMRRVRASGGESVRLWLFEGRQKEGIIWKGARPVGVDPAMLRNVESIMQAARRHRVKVYWTALSANWVWPKNDKWFHGHYNILNDRFGCAQSFKWNVLVPILGRIWPYRDHVFGLDLLNEVQAAVKHWHFTKGWKGAQAWIYEMTAFVHWWAPGIHVTASSGHSTGVQDLLNGRFSGLGLDFYDIHLYNDTGTIPQGQKLRDLARWTGTPIVLGEFGQKTKRRDDDLQYRVTWYFLWSALSLEFKGAFAWRLDDDRAEPGWTAHHSFYIDDQPRPAVWLVRYLTWYYAG
jgi:hypothetical protein